MRNIMWLYIIKNNLYYKSKTIDLSCFKTKDIINFK